MSTCLEPQAEVGFCPPFQEEIQFIQTRRTQAELDEDPTQKPLPPFGLALSGGGIRSATFSLGVVQALAKLGLLKRVDYLSTVSGGSYLGSYLGGLFCPRGAEDAFTASSIQEGLTPAANPAQPVTRTLGWLRENGRYLTPGGSGDAFLAAGTVVRNWVAVMALMLVFALAAWMGLDLVMLRLSGPLEWPFHVLHPWNLKVVLSPWWNLVPLTLLLSFGAGWAYFLVGYPKDHGNGLIFRRPFWIAGLVVLLAGSALNHDAAFPDWLLVGLRITVASGLLALILFGACRLRATDDSDCRRRTARFLRGTLIALCAFAAITLLDSVGWTLATLHREGPAPKGTSLSALLLGALTWILNQLKASEKASWGAALKGWLKAHVLPIAATLLVAVSLSLLAAFSHILSARFPEGLDGAPAAAPLALGILGALTLVTGLTARILGFLNQSTLGPFYTAALTRAYVGASHESRWSGADIRPDRMPADDVPWTEYHPWKRGGPLHILNTTLNETTGGRSQVVQKDRKGMNLAVGPAGISVGVRHHAAWDGPTLRPAAPAGEQAHSVWGNQPVHPSLLTLGQWVGISGAAVSTGLGSSTSLATSLLAGLFNARLGHWWRWGGAPASSRDGLRLAWERALPVQARLFEEWIAHFPGTASRLWNLTDGGHFENTGAYELIRRHTPIIVLSDNGQDQGAHLQDLANLVAKARTDFRTEVAFMDTDALHAYLTTPSQQDTFGTLEDLMDPKHTAVAALAELHYPGSKGLLVVLKPTRTPDLPMDLLDYAHENESFPQQSTGDQFFDERQWESYRKLGEVIAMRALGVPSPQPDKEGRWIPAPWMQAALEGRPWPPEN